MLKVHVKVIEVQTILCYNVIGTLNLVLEIGYGYCIANLA